MKLFRFLLKQYNAPPIFGAAKDLVGRTLFYNGMVATPIAIAAYYAILKPYIIAILPWLSIKIYLVIYFIWLLVMAIFEHKYGKPSSQRWSSQQQKLYDNPVYEGLKEVKKEITDLKKEVQR